MAFGQHAAQPTLGDATAARLRAQRFLAGRTAVATATAATQGNAAGELSQARTQHAAMLRARPMLTPTANLTAPWQALGPATVNSLQFGAITGRITSIALDPNDATGNTVWLGTTGGGVWKSTNAAGPLANITFAPLTNTLPVFAASEGASTLPSLSIGAVAVQPAQTAVVLAGTGDPNDATDSYYGEGILRSADRGQTWTLATGSQDGTNGNHTFAGLATAAIAWSTGNPGLVVAAMSTSREGAVVDATKTTATPGLYFSLDAGVTWQMASIYDGAQIVQVPTFVGSGTAGNSATSVVWDAQRGEFIAALAFHGYYSSPDGQTWTRLAHQPGIGLTTANCPPNTNATGSLNCPMLRGVVAVQPATGDLYALTVDANNNDQGLWQDLCNANAAGVCATPAPVFAARVDNGALEAGQGAPGGATTITQGSYDLALGAVPAANGGTDLYAGTVDLYRCDFSAGSTACTFRNTTNAGDGCNAPAMVAPAQHAVAGVLQGSGVPLVFAGNDGGLWRSLDGVAETGTVCSATDSTHFDNLNPAIGVGGSLAEVVGFAQDPELTGTLLAGLGANGSAATTNAGPQTSWPQISEGEGGYPLIDSVQPANWYVEIGAGINLKLCDVGAACTATEFTFPATVGEAQVAEDPALLDPPVLLDPQNTANLIAGTCRVWRGPAQTTTGWSLANAISAALDGSGDSCSSTSALIRSVSGGGPSSAAAGTANSGSQVVYAGMAGAADGGGSVAGHVFVTSAANTANGSTAWTDIANGAVLNSSIGFNSQKFDVSSAMADAHDATGATVYVTIMGFGASGQEIGHIYGSTDFGAHWTDLSSNLPNAPANSLVVDPSDAHIVYVAMDTGVYVTRAINTCATQNCWTPLGTGLPNAPVTQLEAAAELPTGDGRVGMLRAATYGRGIWQIPLLTAAAPTQAALAVSATSLTFSSQPEATQSSAQAVTLTSSGTAPVTVSSVSTTGDFVESDTCSGQTLAPGATCTISVAFAPTATGQRTGQIAVFGNVPGGQVTIALGGTGTAPAAVVVAPVSLTFPSTVVNQTAASQIITVSNTGGSAASLGAISVTGDFAIAQNTCGTTLAAQAGCSVAITFTPRASGTRSGVLTVNDSAGTQTAQLSGTGQSPATDTLSPLSLAFGQQQIGSTSTAQQMILTNAGDVPLTMLSIAVNGDFTATNGCGSSLAAHSSCAVSVAFVPTATGARVGSLTVTDEVRSQTAALSGTGVAPPGVSLTPSIVNFGAIGVGLNSPVQTLTLTNNGGEPLSILSTTATGDFAIASSTCTNSLGVGGSCSFVLFFAPAAAGARTGTLVLSDNAASASQTVSLSGTGVDFAILPNGPTTASLSSGGSATFPLVLSSVAGLSGNVALSCSGAPANSLCTVSPTTAALGGSVQLSAVVQTGTVAQNRQAEPWPGRRGSEVLFALFPVLLLGVRRRAKLLNRWPAALGSMLLMLACIAGLTGCGSPRVIPLSGGTGGSSSNATPSGAYTITVTGSSAGVNHSVNLTLTVQ